MKPRVVDLALAIGLFLTSAMGLVNAVAIFQMEARLRRQQSQIEKLQFNQAEIELLNNLQSRYHPKRTEIKP
jgi:predicted outer membrane lipoprotein